MDFTHAAALIAAIFGVTELVKSTLPASLASNSRFVVVLHLAVAIGVTFLFASTVWAHTQVIGNVNLDKLGTGDKFLVALLLGGAATFVNRGVGAVMNIGENQPTSDSPMVVPINPPTLDPTPVAVDPAPPAK